MRILTNLYTAVAGKERGGLAVMKLACLKAVDY